jgi:deferrochelatase/peroxidase EfeB
MINQFDPASRPLLEGIQGNILKAHGRHHTANVFVSFAEGQGEAAKKWLSALVDEEAGMVKSAYAQLRDNARYKAGKDRGDKVDTGLFACVHISAEGYRYLLPDEPLEGRFEQTFIDGMAAAGLHDPDPERPYGAEYHVMLLLAHADRKEVDKAAAQIQRAIADFADVDTEPGDALFNAEKAGIEQFGYVDGIQSRASPAARQPRSFRPSRYARPRAAARPVFARHPPRPR